MFISIQLKNGWKVNSVFVFPESYGVGDGAYVWDSRIGTSSPYLNVRWWPEWFSNLYYKFFVRIVWPKGVPDGLVVP